MVVSCETAREINEIVIGQMLETKSHGVFQAVAGDVDRGLGSGGRVAFRWFALGIEASAAGWRSEPFGARASRSLPLGHRGSRARDRGRYHQFTATDAASVLTHGVELGKQTWRDFSRVSAGERARSTR